jgi:hypothetical protein
VGEIQSCTLKKSIIQTFLVHLFFLSDKFKDFKVDNTIFEKAILSKEYSIRNKRDRYLKNSALRGAKLYNETRISNNK